MWLIFPNYPIKNRVPRVDMFFQIYSSLFSFFKSFVQIFLVICFPQLDIYLKTISPEEVFKQATINFTTIIYHFPWKYFQWYIYLQIFSTKMILPYLLIFMSLWKYFSEMILTRQTIDLVSKSQVSPVTEHFWSNKYFHLADNFRNYFHF